MSEPMHVIVRVGILPGRGISWADLIGRHRAASLTEPGCLRFDVWCDANDPTLFLLDEVWASAEALAAHQCTPHYARWREEIPAIRDRRKTHEVYRPFPLLHRVAFANGCFDVIHAGHVQYLQEARRQADMLIVGLDTDASVRSLKGPTRPINTYEDRKAVLLALACVDRVVPYEGDGRHETIRAVRPDVLVKGADYIGRDVIGRDFVESYGGRMHFAAMREGCSTTRMVERIIGRQLFIGE